MKPPHDLTFSALTINCVCHSIRSMFGELGILYITLTCDSLDCVQTVGSPRFVDCVDLIKTSESCLNKKQKWPKILSLVLELPKSFVV